MLDLFLLFADNRWNLDARNLQNSKHCPLFRVDSMGRTQLLFILIRPTQHIILINAITASWGKTDRQTDRFLPLFKYDVSRVVPLAKIYCSRLNSEYKGQTLWPERSDWSTIRTTVDQVNNESGYWEEWEESDDTQLFERKFFCSGLDKVPS